MANKSKLQLANGKQYLVTIPRSLVLAKSWQKGDSLSFTFDQNANIIVNKYEPGADSSKSSLQLRNGKQFVITLPRSIVMAKGWKQGDDVEFVLNEQAKIVIKRIEQ